MNEIEQLEKILIFIDKKYKYIYFDVESEVMANKRTLYTILVSDLEFYLEDLGFKKMSKILKKQFPKLYFIFAYRANAFQ